MLLSDLLGCEVRDEQSQRLGTVIDVRLAAPPDDHQQVTNTRNRFRGQPAHPLRLPRL
jgi:ribosomal 30S subunit maturation factor RimM